jgi:hypothetical protein
MTILRITGAAVIAAGLGFAGTAGAAPAANLSADRQSAQTSNDASTLTPVRYRHHYGYYHYGYYPRYYGYYSYPSYGYYPYPYYGYSPYYYGPSFGFGFTIR